MYIHKKGRLQARPLASSKTRDRGELLPAGRTGALSHAFLVVHVFLQPVGLELDLDVLVVVLSYPLLLLLSSNNLVRPLLLEVAQFVILPDELYDQNRCASLGGLWSDSGQRDVRSQG